MLQRWFSAGIATRRLVVVFCVGVTVIALVVRYSDAFRDAQDTAKANAALDMVDRAVGAGSSVFPDQGVLVEAGGLIPPGGTFTVAVGEPQPGWTPLTAGSAELFLRSYLLPRRLDPNAEWIVCLACDPNAFPEANAIWEGDDGISILHREQ